MGKTIWTACAVTGDGGAAVADLTITAPDRLRFGYRLAPRSRTLAA